MRGAAGCTETDNNSTDFTATTPNPRNTATTLAPCGGGGGGTPTLNINDVTQAEGNAGTTAFTFTVSLTSASTSNVTFTVNTADGTATTANSDYVAIVNQGGTITAGNTSTTVTVTVNGDTTPESNETFTVNITNVSAGATPGDVSGLGTITNDDVTLMAIYTIQGSGTSSPFTGQIVTTTGIVTGRKTNGYFIQDPSGDGNLATSDAIFIFTSSAPTSVAVGDSVQVSGTIAEFESSTTDEPDGVSPPDPKTATELTSPSTSVLSGGNSLPAALDAISLGIFNPAATSRGAELEKYEFMRVSVSSLTVSQPTNNNFGEFWGVVTGTPRPFREPGIEAGDPVPVADEGPYAGTMPPNVPRFDGNFERIMVDSDDALVATGTTRRAALMVTTGAVVTGLVGPLDYGFDQYRIVLDYNVTPGVTPGITAAVAAPTPTAQEFTISHANLENFSSGNATKLNKASLAIRNVLRTPDILGIVEVDTTASAQALANKVNSDAADPNVNYVAYFNDIAGNTQDIGYLVNTARVSVVGSPTAYHQGNTFTYCGVTSTLHDRPSFVLTATVPQAGGGTIPVTVILNHTKSLIAVDSPRSFGTCGTGTEGARNREKRRLQAEDIADLVQSLIGENLVVLGDLNAFDFNDGLIDVVGTLKGIPAPADQVVEPSTDRWTYQLTNLINNLPADQKYSFAFEGNAQALDHVLVNNLMLARNTRYAYGRYNGDFSIDYAADATRPERVADHDAPVAFFTSGAPQAAGTIIISEFRLRGPGSAAPPASAQRAVKSSPAASRLSAKTSSIAAVDPASNDEFVEFYNNSSASVTVSTTDGSAGWALVASDGATRFIIPNTTVIPARGHFLAVNAVGYSLPVTGDTILLPDGVTPASGYTTDIPDNAGIAIFNTANAANFSTATRLDAVGSTSEANTLYKEGTGYPALCTPSTCSPNIDYSFFRDMKTTG
ncbi:MAG: hypothetical protein LC785_08270, partial [Acidobacteria bacterium]|nr:hypothetical protein [Acidobacteriota bacterium]